MRLLFQRQIRLRPSSTVGITLGPSVEIRRHPCAVDQVQALGHPAEPARGDPPNLASSVTASHFLRRDFLGTTLRSDGTPSLIDQGDGQLEFVRNL